MTAPFAPPLHWQGSGVLRSAMRTDDPFLFHLFSVDKTKELRSAGLPGPQVEALVSMQHRGRAMTYSTVFPSARSWIVDQADRSVARLLEDEQAERLHIVDIAVLPEYRRKGIARCLIKTLQLKARNLGKDVSAQIFLENQASRALFVSLGFVEIANPREAYLGVTWLS